MGNNQLVSALEDIANGDDQAKRVETMGLLLQVIPLSFCYLSWYFTGY